MPEKCKNSTHSVQAKCVSVINCCERTNDINLPLPFQYFIKLQNIPAILRMSIVLIVNTPTQYKLMQLDNLLCAK